MEMINCVVIDDEQSCINILKKLVVDYSPDLQILKTFLSPIEAIPFILKHRPQVIFSDIEMDDVDGIKLKQMISEYEGVLVYVTAHSKYAIDAIKAQAFDYLLKPLRISEFIDVNTRIRRQYDQFRSSPKTLTIHTSNSIEIVKQVDIVMIKGDGSYCHIHMKDRKVITASKNIGHFAKVLDTDVFFRTHQSYLVNLKCVQSISKVDGLEVNIEGGYRALLSKTNKNKMFLKLNFRKYD